jgi:hypothetical protein
MKVPSIASVACLGVLLLGPSTAGSTSSSGSILQKEPSSIPAQDLNKDQAQSSSRDQTTQSASRDQASQKDKYALPRGKKLMLKDGTYQLVRAYERNGERVRYYSVERGTWEEIPATMVDWDATAKTEAAEKSEQEALASKVHTREEAQRIDTVMDVDASLQVAPGVFLPPGEGMFVIDGKHVTQLEQAGADVKTDKKQFLKKVLSPIPIVPSKRNVEIPGSQARVRVSDSNLEFYLREAPPDLDRNSPIVKSSRPGESGPEVELVRATVKGNKRQLESIKTFFGEQVEESRKTMSLQRWEIAPTVFRFTLGEPLPPGEYALAEILPDGMNLFVWDFGVDVAAGAKAAASPKK